MRSPPEVGENDERAASSAVEQSRAEFDQLLKDLAWLLDELDERSGTRRSPVAFLIGERRLKQGVVRPS